MLYFAYGSNMKKSQMQDRCPGSRFIARARLEQYKFVYDGHSKNWGGAVGNIIEFANAVVWGGLFEINGDNLAALDKYESYAKKTYDRADSFVLRDDRGEQLRAISYFRKGQPPGEPSEAYRSIVMQGAADCGLPREYIETNL
jgi:gamma-glutamylcyclotransferase (GGCT)/AIG2-like uncharacterized protein YtfP